MSTTHLAYSDESQQNIGRFHAIGMLSLQAEQAKRISSSIQSELAQSEVTEAKWKKIKGARDRFAAQKILDICVQEAREKRLRVDVLIWDTHDERHQILGCDDKKNLENMHIQLYKNVLRKRWSITSTWQLFPDENSAIDWSRLRSTLANTNRFTDQKPNLLQDEWTSLSAHFGIHEIARLIPEIHTWRKPLIYSLEWAPSLMNILMYTNHGNGKILPSQNFLKVARLKNSRPKKKSIPEF